MLEAIRETDGAEAALRRFAHEAAFIDRVEEQGGFRVRTRAELVRAERAASCLLEPAPGDKVLVALSEDRAEAYIVAVLARRDADAKTELKIEGDLKVDARTVELVGKEGISLLTAGDLETAAERLRMKASDAKLFLTSMAYIGGEVVGRVRVAKVAGSMLDGAWQTVRQQARRVYRDVVEGEYVRASTMDVRCDNALALHGENASVTAKKLIKMDSGQILMG
jgi:hypothetical protein